MYRKFEELLYWAVVILIGIDWVSVNRAINFTLETVTVWMKRSLSCVLFVKLSVSVTLGLWRIWILSRTSVTTGICLLVVAVASREQDDSMIAMGTNWNPSGIPNISSAGTGLTRSTSYSRPSSQGTLNGSAGKLSWFPLWLGPYLFPFTWHHAKSNKKSMKGSSHWFPVRHE